MSKPIEVSVDTYIRAWSERDPELRAAMIEACFAADGRIIARGSQAIGRDALAEAITSFLADPQWRRVRMTTAIDASGTTFRFGAAVDRHDGSRDRKSVV